MPRLRALMNWSDRRAGEEFDASDADARILCAPDLPGGQKAELATPGFTPGFNPGAGAGKLTAEENEALTQSLREKQRYLRRDLRAQK
jgi:hypothetical protein